jgi:NAD-dependent SIR2 family protein deacetylase
MYTNKKYDTTMIELFPKNDGLEDICKFLELDELVLKRKAKENKKSVYIPQFPIFSEERKASVSYGIINEIKSDNYDIAHLCNTFPGSSGSPILMLSSNKVIGIHKGGSERFDFNKGTFLKFPIEEYLENKNISIIFKNKEDYYKELENKKIFHLDHFLEKPKDFYKFVKSLNLNELKPNIYYKFMNFFVHKNLVKYIFTQNVDCLEIKAKIPSEKIVYVHGNYLSGHCPNCKKAASIDKIIEGIENEKVYYCPTCNAPCKPKIVLFGESLPEEFFTKIDQCKDIDLIITIGTYLTVTPFSLIPELTNKNAYKLLFNDTEVGNYQYENLEEKSLLILGENKKNIKNFLNDINLLNEYIDFLEKEYGEEF